MSIPTIANPPKHHISTLLDLLQSGPVRVTGIKRETLRKRLYCAKVYGATVSTDPAGGVIVRLNAN